MKLKHLVDLFIIISFSIVLMVMTYEFNRSAHDAEGRIASLEQVVLAICLKSPALAGCETIKQGFPDWLDNKKPDDQ